MGEVGFEGLRWEDIPDDRKPIAGEMIRAHAHPETVTARLPGEDEGTWRLRAACLGAALACQVEMVFLEAGEP